MIFILICLPVKDVTLPTPTTGASQANQPQVPQRPAHATEYNFLDIELKYGILQVKKVWRNFSIFVGEGFDMKEEEKFNVFR